VPQGKGLGGSSIFWDMIYSRGNYRDYNAWRDAGNPEWGYEDVLKHFKKMENNLVPTTKVAGKEGPITVSTVKWRSEIAKALMEAGEEIGVPTVDYNNQNQTTGFAWVQTTNEDGLRQTTHSTYLGLLAVESPNLTVRRRATADKLIVEGDRITGVRFRMGGVNYTAYARYEVIVSAGVFGTPKLLMLSGIGPADHLEEVGIKPVVHLPVGKNLIDHVGVGGLTFFSDQKVIDMQAAFGYYSRVGFYYTHDGELSSPAGVEALAFFDSSMDAQNATTDGYPDYELMFRSGSLVSMPTLRDRHNLNYR
jgi:choline dehydrogenase-like flavoprotein